MVFCIFLWKEVLKWNPKIEKNLIAVDNYKQICNINNDLIVLEEVKIVGENLKIKYLDKNRIIIGNNPDLIKPGQILEI